MKRIPVLLFIFSFLQIPIAQAQEKNTFTKDVIVKLDALSWLDFYSGMSTRAGLEHPLIGRTALYHELGFYLPVSSHAWSGNTWKMELKYYIKTDYVNNEKIYFSIEGAYKQESYKTNRELDDGHYNDHDRPTADFSVSKTTFTFSSKIGIMLFSHRGLLLEAYAGAGVRLRHVENTLGSGQKIYNDGVLLFDKDEKGDFTVPNITAGVKIGYRFIRSRKS